MDDFTMPVPSMGQPVVWYREGAKTGRNPEVAFVLRATRRSIAARLASGVLVETVRHVDDPKLSQGKDQREGGAWDFTPEHYARRAWESDVERRLRNIEKKSVKAPKTQPSNYQVLKSQAIDLGCEFRGNPSKDKLEAMIQEKMSHVDASVGPDGGSVAGED